MFGNHHHRARGTDISGQPPGVISGFGGGYGRDQGSDANHNGFTAYEGGSETRPKNAYVHYIIKY
jgi:hypothetical protein